MGGPVASRDASDAQLVQGWLCGDQAALEHLLARYRVYVMRLCRVAGARPQEVPEWAQVAMLTAVRRLDRYDPGRPFKPWLRQVVLNACRTQRASDLRRRAQEHSLEELAASGDLEGGRPGEEGDPVAERVLRREGLRAIGRVWDELPQAWRVALWLRAVEGLTYDEIAQAGSWPEGTAKTYVYRARQALRAALFEEE